MPGQDVFLHSIQLFQLTPEQIDRARHAVCSHSVDAEEAATFLSMLGLLDG